MPIEKFAKDLKDVPVILIIRGVTPETVIPVTETLCECGVRFVETPLNSPAAIESIRKSSEHFKDREDLHIGAGTVLTPNDVEKVAEAGGTYIISPNFNPEVVKRTKELGLISIPGFFTPSEAFSAIETGADFLKCFPAWALGPKFIKDLKVVLPHPILAVGGVTPQNLGEYLSVADGVGIGASVFTPEMSLDEVKKKVDTFLQALFALKK